MATLRRMADGDDRPVVTASSLVWARRGVLRAWPLMLAVFYAAFVWAHPPLVLFDWDASGLTAALFGAASVSAFAAATVPRWRTETLPFIMAAPLFRGLTLMLGDTTTTNAAGQAVASAAYLTVFVAIVSIYLLSLPMAADAGLVTRPSDSSTGKRRLFGPPRLT